jgi:hypothetical protein
MLGYAAHKAHTADLRLQQVPNNTDPMKSSKGVDWDEHFTKTDDCLCRILVVVCVSRVELKQTIN